MEVHLLTVKRIVVFAETQDLGKGGPVRARTFLDCEYDFHSALKTWNKAVEDKIAVLLYDGPPNRENNGRGTVHQG